MTIQLLDLPNEILTIIFSYTDSTCSVNDTVSAVTKPSICALALTCRRTSTLSRNLICRNIRLERTPSELASMLGASEGRLELLLRTWRNDPTWYLNRLYQVDWLMPTTNNTVCNEFFDYIAQSESLHELNLLDCRSEDIHRLVTNLHHDRGQHSTLGPKTVHPHLYTGLRILRIRPSQRFFNYTDVFLKLCTAPYLQHLEAGGYGISTMIMPQDVEATLHELSHLRSNQSPKTCKPSSGLVSLHISRQSFVDVTDLGRILTVCSERSSLERLQIPPPAPGIKYDDGRRDRFPETNQRCSPKAISTALLSIAETLQTLSITDSKIIFYAAPDGTRLDLSRFSALRVLKVSSFVLAGGHGLSLLHRLDHNRRYISSTLPPPPPPPPIRLWETLPPNLEELYVAFDALQGVFYSLDSFEFSPGGPFHVPFGELWDRGPGWAMRFERALWWVAELAERREQSRDERSDNDKSSRGTTLQRLKRIDLVECHDAQLLQTALHVEIGLKSLSLRTAQPDVFRRFDELGIRVDIRVYVPSEWPSL